ncbi:type 1 fimbrial protein [Dyella amyloliquefaciens]|uniref:type 1 fimbrial protein n=1 Tax=Dyella amyloliquefaciens TaxID=1770545 RepID=UPI00102E3CB7|nr:type 1 fimbrial protein [Dyella amyloliquefaciens]
MARKRVLAFVALAACIGTAGAQGASGRLTFEGRIVQSTCNVEQPQLGRERGVGCGQEGVRSIDMERMLPAAQAADSAMLDYFLERSQGDAKFALTRQYR